MKKAEFILVSGMDPDFARMLLFTPAKDMTEALALAYAKLGPAPDHADADGQPDRAAPGQREWTKPQQFHFSPQG